SNRVFYVVPIPGLDELGLDYRRKHLRVVLAVQHAVAEELYEVDDLATLGNEVRKGNFYFAEVPEQLHALDCRRGEVNNVDSILLHPVRQFEPAYFAVLGGEVVHPLIGKNEAHR